MQHWQAKHCFIQSENKSEDSEESQTAKITSVMFTQTLTRWAELPRHSASRISYREKQMERQKDRVGKSRMEPCSGNSWVVRAELQGPVHGVCQTDKLTQYLGTDHHLLLCVCFLFSPSATGFSLSLCISLSFFPGVSAKGLSCLLVLTVYSWNSAMTKSATYPE